MSDFENPYSTAPRSGFILTTFDTSGCSIDESSALTYTVSDWATLSSPLLTRNDANTEVSLASQFAASFNLPFPVD